VSDVGFGNLATAQTETVGGLGRAIARVACRSFRLALGLSGFRTHPQAMPLVSSETRRYEAGEPARPESPHSKRLPLLVVAALHDVRVPARLNADDDVLIPPNGTETPHDGRRSTGALSYIAHCVTLSEAHACPDNQPSLRARLRHRL